MTLRRQAAAALAGVAMAAAVLAARARRRWHRSRQAALLVLDAAVAGSPVLPSVGGDLEDRAAWPEPLRRFLEFAIVGSDTRPITRALFFQEGEFASRRGSWFSFTAEAHYGVEPPASVRDARLRLMPFAGGGLAVASLERFLAELPFMPTALLRPSARLRWQALGERRLRANLTEGGATASAEFELGELGEIATVTALRGREAGGQLVPTPWEGRFSDYREIGGLRLPHSAEAAWILPAGRMPYWRGRIVRCELRRG